jgi:hypothetical protein
VAVQSLQPSFTLTNGGGHGAHGCVDEWLDTHGIIYLEWLWCRGNECGRKEKIARRRMSLI